MRRNKSKSVKRLYYEMVPLKPADEERIRRLLPLGSGVGLDLSPIILIFALLFIKYYLVASLYQMSAKLK